MTAVDLDAVQHLHSAFAERNGFLHLLLGLYATLAPAGETGDGGATAATGEP